MRLVLPAFLLRCCASVKAPKDEQSRDFIISDHGSFQSNIPRLLRVDSSTASRSADLWERFGFGPRQEDDAAFSRFRVESAPVGLFFQDWPGPTLDLQDELPVSEPQQGIAEITEEKWPVNFCINATVEAPDPNAEAEIPGEHYKVIALLGGGGKTGADSCGNFIVFLTDTNQPGMGVSASGTGMGAGNMRPCNAERGLMSDKAVATKESLTPDSFYALTWCYNSAKMLAQIYINGALKLEANKEYIFPREGMITFNSGSHTKNQEVLRTEISQFSISPFPTTTSTTTTGTVTTTRRNPDRPALFRLLSAPVDRIAPRTAEIVGSMWPADFCISVNVTAPIIRTGKRTIALFGNDEGSDRCGGFEIFFADLNAVGMGPACVDNRNNDVKGQTADLITSVSVDDAITRTAFLSFCYASIEGKASILRHLPGKTPEVLQAEDRAWKKFVKRKGFVTVFGGSHLSGNSFQELQEATLWEMYIEECTPSQMPRDPSTPFSKGRGPREEVSGARTETTTTLNITEAIGEALGGLTTQVISTSTTTTSTTTTSTTTTTTTITQQMREHIVVKVNNTDTKTNHTEHHHYVTNSVEDHTDTQTDSHEISGDEVPVKLLEDPDEDEFENALQFPRYIPSDMEDSESRPDRG